MKGLLATVCCCGQEPFSACWRAWLECPEYVKVTLPGIAFEERLTVCTPNLNEQYWWLYNSPGFPISCKGVSPYPANWDLEIDQTNVRATNILLRKKITYGGFGSGPPVYVEYENVPTPDQTGVLHVTSSGQSRGAFMGYQSGGPMPMVIDSGYGDASIPLNGTHQDTIGSVESATMRVYQVQASPSEPIRCRVELNVKIFNARKLGGLIWFYYPKWPSGVLYIDGCNLSNQGYADVLDLSGSLEYREIWTPINLSNFFKCPADMDSSSSDSATYFPFSGLPIQATETIRQEWEDCDPFDYCITPGCGQHAFGCKGFSEYRGRGRATIIGTNTP
jgi:hypothetical protein